MVTPKYFDPKLSLGNVGTILVVIVGGAMAWQRLEATTGVNAQNIQTNSDRIVLHMEEIDDEHSGIDTQFRLITRNIAVGETTDGILRTDIKSLKGGVQDLKKDNDKLEGLLLQVLQNQRAPD